MRRQADEWIASSLTLLAMTGFNLPDGQIRSRLGSRRVQPCLQKYFAGPVGQIKGTDSRVLGHRGALANVINAARDAVDADALNDEQRETRTAKSCGPDAPTLASSFA
jgi:hypothetical protein